LVKFLKQVGKVRRRSAFVFEVADCSDIGEGVFDEEVLEVLLEPTKKFASLLAGDSALLSFLYSKLRFFEQVEAFLTSFWYTSWKTFVIIISFELNFSFFGVESLNSDLIDNPEQPGVEVTACCTCFVSVLLVLSMDEEEVFLDTPFKGLDGGLS
jgi:hypothetical protein